MADERVPLETPIKKGQQARHYNKINKLYENGLSKEDALLILKTNKEIVY